MDYSNLGFRQDQATVPARFARWVYLIAGVYGLLILIPGFFLERMVDPAGGLLAHPEFYYGFYGSALAWQLVFLLIASNPRRYWTLMPFTFVEKAVFPISNFALFTSGRLGLTGPFIGGLIDLVLGGLFVAAWLHTRPAAA